MTAIGIVRNHNRVEVNFIDQLKIILKRQFELVPDVFHNFTYQEFEHRDLLDFYIEHPNYGLEEERPGLCFAFEIVKYSDQRYELHLFFNDQIIKDRDGSGIPRQALDAVDPTSNNADIVAFDKYMNSGFSHIQNWVANTILQHSTDNK